MLSIGYTGDDRTVRRHIGPDQLQHAPWIFEVFESVAEYPAVPVAVVLEEFFAGFVDAQCGGLVTKSLGEFDVAWIDVDAVVVANGIGFLELPGQGARTAANFDQIYRVIRNQP